MKMKLVEITFTPGNNYIADIPVGAIRVSDEHSYLNHPGHYIWYLIPVGVEKK